jgi:hypothetical protein
MDERPISVGELLRREGQASEPRDSQARRALGGVAVGAVLAFGAVVGGLVLHNAGAAPSDMPVAGGGSAGGMGFNGSVPVASTGTIGSNSPKIQPAANTTNTSVAGNQNGTTPSSVGGSALGGAPSKTIAQTTDPTYPSTSGTLPTTTGSTSTGATSTGTSTTSHSSGSTNPSTTSSNPGSTSTGTTTTGSNGGGSNGGGGLLGTVGNTLGSVTQPVFNWFGGN